MKKIILIDCLQMGEKWAGGLYYSKNIAFLLSQNEYIEQNYIIEVCCSKNNKDVFNDLDNVKIIYPWLNNKHIVKYYSFLYSILHQVAVIYWKNKYICANGMRTVAWIPDFQHKHFASFFSSDEILIRDKRYSGPSHRKMNGSIK